jgi:magnesium chelatase family protein
VEVQPVGVESLMGGKKAESSGQIRERVLRARERQKERFAKTRYRFNADIEAADINSFCRLGSEEERLMEQLYHSLQLSARAYHRILKVARTIADLDGAEEIETAHLLEASCYRPALGKEG